MLRISNMMNRMMVIIGIFICGFLSILAFLFTQYHGDDMLGEQLCQAPLYQRTDVMLLHVITCLLIVILLNAGYKIQKNYSLEKLERGIIILDFIVIGLFSLYWVMNCQPPKDDQAHLIQAAYMFLEGNYDYLRKGYYLNLYPQQLGLVGLYQIILGIFPGVGFKVIQYIHIFFTVGSFGLIYSCMKELGAQPTERIIFVVFPIVMFPFLMYTPFVYGEIPSIYFMLLFGRGVMRLYQKNMGMKNLLLTIFAGWGMIVTRINSLIMIIAFVIVASITLLYGKKWRLFLLSILIACSCMIPVKAVEGYYENASGYEVDGGMPHILWIAMGSRDSASKPGWFDNYPATNYYECNLDKEKASERAINEIKSHMQHYIRNPMECMSFYKRKVCTQWNDPTYNFLHYGLGVDYDMSEYERTDFAEWLVENRYSMVKYLSIVQFIVYSGLFWYVLGTPHRPETIYKDIFLITIIGGFLFSIIWEADSRYTLPYYVLMIPYTFIGWGQVAKFLMRKVMKEK